MTTSSVLCGAAPVFVVKDVLASVAHFRDALGFRQEFIYLDGNRLSFGMESKSAKK